MSRRPRGESDERGDASAPIRAAEAGMPAACAPKGACSVDCGKSADGAKLAVSAIAASEASGRCIAPGRRAAADGAAVSASEGTVTGAERGADGGPASTPLLLGGEHARCEIASTVGGTTGGAQDVAGADSGAAVMPTHSGEVGAWSAGLSSGIGGAAAALPSGQDGGGMECSGTGAGTSDGGDGLARRGGCTGVGIVGIISTAAVGTGARAGKVVAVVGGGAGAAGEVGRGVEGGARQRRGDRGPSGCWTMEVGARGFCMCRYSLRARTREEVWAPLGGACRRIAQTSSIPGRDARHRARRGTCLGMYGHDQRFEGRVAEVLFHQFADRLQPVGRWPRRHGIPARREGEDGT